MSKEKTEHIADALCELEDAFLVEAVTYRSKKLSNRKKYVVGTATCAAAVCIMICGQKLWIQREQTSNATAVEGCYQNEGITFEGAKVETAQLKEVTWREVSDTFFEDYELEKETEIVELPGKVNEALTEEKQEYETLTGMIVERTLYQLEEEEECYFAVITIEIIKASIKELQVGDRCRIYVPIMTLDSLKKKVEQFPTNEEITCYVTPIDEKMGEERESGWFFYQDVADYKLEK